MNKVRCLVCDSPMPGDASEWPDRPLCSKRCRIIDLGRWLGEEYRIAGAPAADSPDAAGDADD